MGGSWRDLDGCTGRRGSRLAIRMPAAGDLGDQLIEPPDLGITGGQVVLDHGPKVLNGLTHRRGVALSQGLAGHLRASAEAICSTAFTVGNGI